MCAKGFYCCIPAFLEESACLVFIQSINDEYIDLVPKGECSFYSILNEILHLLGKHILANHNPNRFYILMNTIINHGNGDLPANSQRNVIFYIKTNSFVNSMPLYNIT